MKIAYIVSAYKLPDQLIRLIRKLNTTDTWFFIHVDKKTDSTTYRIMTQGLNIFPNVHFLSRHTCYWGDFGHVKATLKGLNTVFKHRIPFDYVILLTGQDYPLRSNEQIKAFLAQSRGNSYISYMPLPRSKNSVPISQFPPPLSNEDANRRVRVSLSLS